MRVPVGQQAIAVVDAPCQQAGDHGEGHFQRHQPPKVRHQPLVAEDLLDPVDDLVPRRRQSAAGRAATRTRSTRPQMTTLGPDRHRMPSTGGTFLSACTRSRHALREDCGLASVMKFRFLERTRPSARLGIRFLSNVTNEMHIGFACWLKRVTATCGPRGDCARNKLVQVCSL